MRGCVPSPTSVRVVGLGRAGEMAILIAAVAAVPAALGQSSTNSLAPRITTSGGEVRLQGSEITLSTDAGSVAVTSLVQLSSSVATDLSRSMDATRISIEGQISATTSSIQAQLSGVASAAEADATRTTASLEAALSSVRADLSSLGSRIDDLNSSGVVVDRRVSALESTCTDTQFRRPDGTCRRLTECRLGQYVVREPNATSDRLCEWLNSTNVRNVCPNGTFWFRGRCEQVPIGCRDRTVEQAISPNMVGCRKTCNTAVDVRRAGSNTPSPIKWNRFWETACAPGWHMCFGQEAMAENDDCDGVWNANFGIFSYSVGNFWGECGSGQTTAYTSTVRGKSCRSDLSRTALHPGAHDYFDGIYGGFVAGRTDLSGNQNSYYYGNGVGQSTSDRFAHRGWPHIRQCKTVGWGSEGFAVRSKYPSACSQNFCNTCASGYFSRQEGTLCCRGS